METIMRQLAKNMQRKQGLYDPRFEHDACGVGFICNYKGKKSHEVVAQALEALRRLSHRGATGADPKTGDGAGILIQMPHEFFAQEAIKIKPIRERTTPPRVLPQHGMW